LIYFIKVIYNSFILPPGVFIFGFFVVAFISRKKQRKVAVLSLVLGLLLYLLSNDIVSGILISPLEYTYTPPSELDGDVIIVLGGGGIDKSPNLGFEGHMSSNASNRLITVNSLYQKTGLPIIFSGGLLYDLNDTEANIGSMILTSFGIPRDKILLEDKSQNTAQNAEYTARILNEKNFSRPILVTSAYHIPRAVREFAKNNVTVTPFPAGYKTSRERKVNILTLSPSSGNLDKSAIALKEYLGILRIKVWS
jgi:uncharacterized SAM-binding protein YcdF (DUF218 family)